MEQTDHLMSGLAGVIRAAIDDRGLTLREVSNATGIPTTTLHRRITQPSPFNITELASLATLMGTTVVDLMVEARRHSPASDGTSDPSPTPSVTGQYDAGDIDRSDDTPRGETA